MVKFPVYFLTWTTYGTWLPGDRRGWVDAADAGPSTPIKAPNARREQHSRARMKEAAVTLSPQERKLVDDALREVARFRGWRLHALNVRSNHVHAVVECHGVGPEQVMSQLKARASRYLNDLRRAKGLTPPVKWWTRHGSTRWLNTQTALERAVHYVLNQ